MWPRLAIPLLFEEMLALVRKGVALGEDAKPLHQSALAALVAAAAGGLGIRDGVAVEEETHGEATSRGPGT